MTICSGKINTCSPQLDTLHAAAFDQCSVSRRGEQPVIVSSTHPEMELYQTNGSKTTDYVTNKFNGEALARYYFMLFYVLSN